MVSEHFAHQLDSYRRHMVEGTNARPPKPVDVEQLVTSGREGPLGSFMYGTPKAVAEQIRDYTAGAPVRTVFLWASIGGMAEADVARNVQTICTRLAPLLADTGCEQLDQQGHRRPLGSDNHRSHAPFRLRAAPCASSPVNSACRQPPCIFTFPTANRSTGRSRTRASRRSSVPTRAGRGQLGCDAWTPHGTYAHNL